MSKPTRADILGGHLILLRLAEQIPEITLQSKVQISLAGGDTSAVAHLDQLFAALTAHGIPFTEVSNDHHREICFMTGAVPCTVTHVWDRVMADYYARRSYDDNVRIDRDGVQA